MPKSGFARKFGGKRYSWKDRRPTKSDARRHAKNLRKRGSLARVTKASNGYDVWAKKRK